MKTPRRFLPQLGVKPLLLLATLVAAMASAPSVRAQTGFGVGSIVTTNFGLMNRLRWTNDNGQVFTPTNTQIRLSDFDGKIVFFCFFDVW